MAKQKAKIVQVGDDDHTADPRYQSRKKAFSKKNVKWDAELDSTKIEIPTDVLVEFIAMYSHYRGENY